MSDLYRTHIRDHGRVVIPAAVRQQLGFRPGDEVFVRIDQDRVVITPAANAVAAFQAAVAEYFPCDRSLADELVAERRAEAAREQATEIAPPGRHD